ncbi:MAG: hypothetical protein AB1Z20_12000, partial [Desulfobacterales bacterium]
ERAGPPAGSISLLSIFGRLHNLFGSLDIEIWDFTGIWCLEFEISDYLNTRDSISKDYLSIGRYR